jgi:hypothetical protein
VAALGVLLASGHMSHAQSYEASFLAGFTPSASLDRRAPELRQLDVRGGFTWGVQAGRFFGDRWGAEILWTRQQSALQVENESGRTDLFLFDVSDLHANAVYSFAGRKARLRPFLFGGLGATFFTGGELPSETKLSLSLGGGASYLPWKSVGFRGHVRWKPVFLNDTDAGDFCDPFGFCQSWLSQFELMGGVTVRF